MNVYGAVEQQGEQMIFIHYSYNDYAVFSSGNRA